MAVGEGDVDEEGERGGVVIIHGVSIQHASTQGTHAYAAMRTPTQELLKKKKRTWHHIHPSLTQTAPVSMVFTKKTTSHHQHIKKYMQVSKHTPHRNPKSVAPQRRRGRGT